LDTGDYDISATDRPRDMESDSNTQSGDGAEGDETQDATELWRHRMKTLKDLENFDEVG